MSSFQLGVGLRPPHYPHFLQKKETQLDFLEVISENYMDTEGRPKEVLAKIRQDYPIALHGVSLSIAGTDEFNPQYLQRLKNLIAETDPLVVSDHLCWTGVHGQNLHDLMPVPYTEEVLKHIVNRVDEIQNYFKRPWVLENVSSYIRFQESTYTEFEFLNEVCKRTGCGLLLDINNIYVSAINHQFDGYEFLDNIKIENIRQVHLAGFTDMGEYLFDTHSKPVFPAVWELYEHFAKKNHGVPTLIEWDDEIPEFEELQEEAIKAKTIWSQHNE